jgi:N,N-dimethylformamidase beta subunit-like protein
MIGRRSLLRALMTGATGLLPVSAQGQADTCTGASALDKDAGQKAIWKSPYDDTRVWGYADQHSVSGGEGFHMMLSSGPGLGTINGTIEIFRIGYHADGDRKLMWRDENVAVLNAGEALVTSGMIGAGWPTAIENIDTTGWSSGYYTIDFIDRSDGNRDSNVAYIVVTNKDRSGDILVQLSTNTYQAYNEWGGYSFYACDFVGSHARMISFDRPTPPDFFEYEYFLVLWLERLAAELGLTIDYATNFDIHRDPAFTQHYPLFISGSHNEYWSKEEYDAVYRRIFERGKNTIFFGANTAYWQVRYADVNGPDPHSNRGRQLICYKSIEDPIRYRVSESKAMDLITMRFRDMGRRPETMLMGSAYQSYFSRPAVPMIKYPYFVARTDLPFFQGTGYRVGDPIGDLVGYEWDNTDPDQDGARLWSAQTSRIAPIDRESIKVLFTGAPVDIDGHPGKAEAVYFESNAGAKVFNAGSIRWSWGLGKPEFESDAFKTFHRNLLLHFIEHSSPGD